MTPQEGPLEGIVVCDFSWVGAGPIATKVLADFGATVIKIESTKHPDVGRYSAPFKDNIIHPDRSAFFLHSNTSKLSVTLNIRHPKGVEIAKKIVRISDIVMENFTPGVISKLGLGYEELKKIKPDIIMASSSIYGQTGPKSRFSGFGNSGAAISGHHMLTGWPDRDPVTPGIAYADVVQPLFSAAALLAAIDYRDRTGQGQYIDSTQVESMVQFISPALLDYYANGRVQSRMWQPVFLCVATRRFPLQRARTAGAPSPSSTKSSGRPFAGRWGIPAWARAGKFSTLPLRQSNEDELESLISQWTITYARDDLVAVLQEAGVASGPVQDASDLVDRDPQLRERQSFVKLTHPVIGECNHPAPAVKLSKSPSHIKTSPCLGEHNEYVLFELLGISDEEFVELLNEGVLE